MSSRQSLRPWLDRATGYVALLARAPRHDRASPLPLRSPASGMVPGVRRLSGSREGTLGNWSPRREERLSEARSIDTIMARAESLAANDGNATSAIDSLALNVAGPGLRPQSYPDATVLGISEEEAQAFADSAEAQYLSKEAPRLAASWVWDLQYQAVRSMLQGRSASPGLIQMNQDAPLGWRCRSASRTFAHTF